MARLSDTFLHNERAKTASAWHELRGGVRLRVAWFYSEALQKAMREKPEEKAVNLFAEHLLLGWENIENDDGTPMEATYENKLSVLTGYNEILSSVIAFSQNPQNFLHDDEVNKELGN